MNYPYEKGEEILKATLIILDFIGFLFLGLAVIFLLKDSNFVIIDFSSFGVLVILFGLLLSLLLNVSCIVAIILIRKNRLKKIENIMNLGYRTTGTVLSVVDHKNDCYTRVVHSYWMVVQFVDRDGITKKFNTPALVLIPKVGYPITCDVFVYNNVCYAYNFSNFYIDRNINGQYKCAIIITLVFTTIMFILMYIGILII